MAARGTPRTCTSHHQYPCIAAMPKSLPLRCSVIARPLTCRPRPPALPTVGTPRPLSSAPSPPLPSLAASAARAPPAAHARPASPSGCAEDHVCCLAATAPRPSLRPPPSRSMPCSRGPSQSSYEATSGPLVIAPPMASSLPPRSTHPLLTASSPLRAGPGPVPRRPPLLAQRPTTTATLPAQAPRPPSPRSPRTQAPVTRPHPCEGVARREMHAS